MSNKRISVNIFVNNGMRYFSKLQHKLQTQNTTIIFKTVEIKFILKLVMDMFCNLKVLVPAKCK